MRQISDKECHMQKLNRTMLKNSMSSFRERVKGNKILNKFGSRNLGLTVNVVLWIVLLITTIAKFVPFSPAMPAAGLDPSWVFGLNQAVAQGLSFGKEIASIQVGR